MIGQRVAVVAADPHALLGDGEDLDLVEVAELRNDQEKAGDEGQASNPCRSTSLP